MSTEQQYTYYPLTLYDAMFKDAAVVMGWLVEGLLDIRKLEAALNRLVTKWPMLAGRLEITDGGRLHIKVPIGDAPFPAGYAPYTLTSRKSDVPISDYVQLPLPIVSDVLPSSLFMDPSAPRAPSVWITKKIPLTLWNLTYFTQGDCQYTCIGLTFPHGIFDGMGIASVIHALEAESLNKRWAIPPPLNAGHNDNPLQIFLERDLSESEHALPDEYRSVSVFGLWLIIMYIFWHFWQEKWHGAHSRLILLPTSIYEKLVIDARDALAREGKTSLRLSTGDVLTAWLFKTIYSADESSKRLINLSNMASLRMFSDAALNQYAHNCFIPIPNPVFTVAELKATPVHLVAYKLAKARAALSVAHSRQIYKYLEDCAKPRKGILDIKAVITCHADADENLSVSNMSIARVVDINWTGLGGQRTLCRYKSLISEVPVLISNTVTIAGRLDNGTTVVDVVLNQRRMRRLEAEVLKLVDQARK